MVSVLSLFEQFPFLLRQLFHQSLQLLIVVYRLTHARFQLLGNIELAQFALLTLHQIKRNMRLTSRAATSLLATGHVSHRKRAAQQPTLVHQLRDARAAAATDCRDADSFHSRSEERRVGKECRSRWSP